MVKSAFSRRTALAVFAAGSALLQFDHGVEPLAPEAAPVIALQ